MADWLLCQDFVSTDLLTRHRDVDGILRVDQMNRVLCGVNNRELNPLDPPVGLPQP